VSNVVPRNNLSQASGAAGLLRTRTDDAEITNRGRCFICLPPRGRPASGPREE
jgi:hypothetical protein